MNTSSNRPTRLPALDTHILQKLINFVWGSSLSTLTKQIYFNNNREDESRCLVTFSLASILHMCRVHTHSHPLQEHWLPFLVTNTPGYATGNWLVTKSFAASNTWWHVWSEEIQKSPPRDLAITKSAHHRLTSLLNPRALPGFPPPD